MQHNAKIFTQKQVDFIFTQSIRNSLQTVAQLQNVTQVVKIFLKPIYLTSYHFSAVMPNRS